ncbi:hypothetical protein [Tenacibaculum sp. 190524A05c]|uniref:hypothetical protein n=1 Tax=Tenacibaculum platacis TaxID=3137852 RepID=UPI0032B2C78F
MKFWEKLNFHKNNSKNIFLLGEINREYNQMFSKGDWVFILFTEYSESEITFLQQFLEVAKSHSNLHFAFKLYIDKSKINDFSEVIGEVKNTPVILFKKGGKTKFLPSREYDITELDVLLGNFNYQLEEPDIPKCYLCNTIKGLNEVGKCTLCSGSNQKVKPKCIIDKRKVSSIEEIKEFLNISDHLFFEFDNYNTLIFGDNIIAELLKMLEETIDDDLDYKIFLALRMLGVEIWGSSKENIKYRYRLPEEDVFKEMEYQKSNFKIKIQTALTARENIFTINTQAFPKNLSIINYIEYDNNSKFFDGKWIFFLFKEYADTDIKTLYEIIEIAKEYPDLNFGLKSFKSVEKIKEFITTEIKHNNLPKILFRDQLECYPLANQFKSKEELKKILDNI